MKNFITWFKTNFSPLQQLLWIGFFVRMFSVVFSKGFGWHDDHFLIIEAAQSWVDGYDYNNWFPSAENPDVQAQGHPLMYVGLHYCILSFFHFVGIDNPQTKMTIIRFLHALLSLLIIKYGYKIAEQYSNKKVAWYVGIFLTLYWFMPFVSVRNLVEFVCVPAFLIAIYRLGKENTNTKDFLIAGFWLGMAFATRYQSLFITAGIGLALLIMKKPFKYLLLTALSFLFVVCITEGLISAIIWKQAFAEFLVYVQYNIDNATAYGYNNYLMYIELILGLLIPPLSILLFAGYFYSWKKMPLLFWSTLVYLAFHTYFPNKQERFVMTIIPLIIISGTVGMFMIYDKYKERINQKLFRFCKIFVIILNLILLPILTLSYSKRHRVEAMMYMYNKHDSNIFIVEDSNKENDFLMPPLYYYGKWITVVGINKQYAIEKYMEYYSGLAQEKKPTYVVFWQAENIEARVNSVKKHFPDLKYEATIEPSFIDKTLYWLNPLNDNQTAFIYRIK